MLQTILHGWIFLELLVVSFFLWTVIDPIYVLTANRAIDRGYNPEGLYVVNIGMYDETNGNFDPDMASDSMNLVAYTRLARIVREQPEVECWAIAGNQSFPCSNSWSGTQIFADTASLHKGEGLPILPPCTRGKASYMPRLIVLWQPMAAICFIPMA